MRSIAVNGQNDMFRGPDGNLAIVTGLEAVSQGCAHAMKTQVASLTLNLPRGVPTDAAIWQRWQPARFEAAARAILLTVPHVTRVVSFTITRADGVAFYTAVIESDFGPTEISGDLTP